MLRWLTAGESHGRALVAIAEGVPAGVQVSTPDIAAALAVRLAALRPGVVVVADGNPHTRRALEAAGCEVHTYPATEIGLNGSGGPTCLTRPLRRDTGS